MRKSRFPLFLLVCGLIFLAGAGYAINALLTPPPFAYFVQAEFRELPAHDEGLKQWLTEQPGVKEVQIIRLGNIIEVSWMNEDAAYADPIPDLRPVFAQLGYRHATSYVETRHVFERFP